GNRARSCAYDPQELGHSNDARVAELTQPQQIFVLRDDHIGTRRRCTFQDPIVVRVLPNDAESLYGLDQICQGEELFTRILDHVAVPLKLSAQHAERFAENGVGDDDTNSARAGEAEEQCRRPAEMKGPDIYVGVQSNADQDWCSARDSAISRSTSDSVI